MEGTCGTYIKLEKGIKRNPPHNQTGQLTEEKKKKRFI
jgi:hypothetical protein